MLAISVVTMVLKAQPIDDGYGHGRLRHDAGL